MGAHMRSYYSPEGILYIQKNHAFRHVGLLQSHGGSSSRWEELHEKSICVDHLPAHNGPVSWLDYPTQGSPDSPLDVNSHDRFN